MKQYLISLAVLIILVLAVMAFVPPWQKNTTQLVSGAVTLTDLGVSLELPQGLAGLAVATSSSVELGTVYHFAIPASESSALCQLGFYYRIDKSALGSGSLPWDVATLDAATVVDGTTPPQAKDLGTAYLVFEPAQDACAQSAVDPNTITALREALWIAVSSAMPLTATVSDSGSIEDYVRAHINELSPTPAVLGGTFQVTALAAHGGAGTVSYEDGHIALVADFTYETDAQGVPAVTSFTVRP